MRELFLCCLALNLLFLSTPPTLAVSPDQLLSLETFDEETLLTFPKRWQVRGNTETAHIVYRVMAEGRNQFLHARADQQAIQIGLTYPFAPGKFPLLHWRWRVTRLPPNANEAHKDTHDSAAGVYVIFDNQLLPRIIKYVWSTTLPVGARVQNPLYWRAKIVVLESGAAGLGEWRQETVNVLHDYQTLFGESPARALGIGLATSSSFTRSIAEADYDDFTLLTSQAVSIETELNKLP
ncbi:MAG: DUF3047 domain-containing protein [Candidatus Binatia bacterium]